MRILEALRIYLDRRVSRILLIGFISGFPWVLTGTILTLWLRDFGLTRTVVGWAGAITFVYAINFLWAPLVDRLSIPYLCARLGQRRGWIVMLQGIILVALALWSLLAPDANLTAIVFLGLIISIASATQDVAIDALRIEQVGASDSKLMAAGAAAATIGWWTGFKLGGAIALATAEVVQALGVRDYWHLTILLMTGVIVLCNIGLMFVRERPSAERTAAQRKAQQRYVRQLSGSWQPRARIAELVGWLATTIVEPLWSFFRRNGAPIALALLGFIFLFKIGEAFLGRMSVVFYQDIGISKTDIAIYSKGFGWLVTVAFTLAGSFIAVRVGIIRALVFSGLAMAVTNLLFSALAWTGKSEWLFAVAVVVDDITGAIATVTFVAFISLLVDRTYTATQYALLASIGTAARTLLASSSGWAVDALHGDWGTFFVITAVMVLPSLACLWMLRHRIHDLIGTTRTLVRG